MMRLTIELKLGSPRGSTAKRGELTPERSKAIVGAVLRTLEHTIRHTDVPVVRIEEVEA
jgi:hypothetical protein